MAGNIFRFVGFNYDECSGELILRYNSCGLYDFEERIIFLGERRNLTAEEKEILNRVFKALHIAAGISYYKAFLCPETSFDSYTLSLEEEEFFNVFYKKGLGEFAWRNNVNVPYPFESNGKSCGQAHDIVLPHQNLIAVGGGKDSSVTIELMKKTGMPCTLFAMGRHQAIANTVRIASLPCVNVIREISPLLLEMNRTSGVLNGHVPITGILSFILAASAIIYGFDTVVMSNERSANVGNTDKGGLTVNHQWSKSIEFENMFIKFIKENITPSLRYFSLLRPYSELAIAGKFAEFPQYHRVFTSCNRAFKYVKENRTDCWCGECDKCRFVFLILAPFLTKDTMIGIFGSNLLDNLENRKGYAELLGLEGFKPFECVGEIEESVAALFMLSKIKEWNDSFILQNLLPQVINKYSVSGCQDFMQKSFAKSDVHNIPKEIQNAGF